MRSYNVICLKCQAERPIKIQDTAVGKRIDWLESPDNISHPIVSGRERLDGEWGFECICGNNDLLTRQERRTFTSLSNPDPQEITQVVKNLKSDPPKFKMVTM